MAPAQSMNVGSAKGIASAASYIISQFLSDSHCYSLLTSLSGHYASWRPLATVKKVVADYGIVLSEEDDEYLSLLEVEKPIDTNKVVEHLTKKLPQGITKEELKRFVLQCQLVMSTSTRLDKALCDGSSKGIEEVLNDANEVTAIMPSILKMSVAQAGKESVNIIKHEEQWNQKNSERLWQLLENLEGSNQLQKELFAAQTQLLQHSHSHKEKARKAMVTLCGKNSEALTVGVFGEWKALIAQLKIESELRTEFQDRLDKMDKEMIKMKMEKMENMKRVFLRTVQGDNLALLTECFGGMRLAVVEAKREAANAAKVAEAEARLAAYAANQLKSANQVMSRMSASCDSNLLTSHFREWAQFVASCKEAREQEEKAKIDELNAAERLKAKSEESKKLIQRMTIAFGSALQETVFKVWAQDVQQERRDREAEALIKQSQDKMAAFFEKNKMGAINAYSNMGDVGIFSAKLHAFILWNQVIRVDRLVFLFERKLEGKVKQMGMLRGAFSAFEANINHVTDLHRDDASNPEACAMDTSVSPSALAGPPARALLRADGGYAEDPHGDAYVETYTPVYAPVSPPAGGPPQRPGSRTYRAA